MQDDSAAVAVLDGDGQMRNNAKGDRNYLYKTFHIFHCYLNAV